VKQCMFRSHTCHQWATKLSVTDVVSTAGIHIDTVRCVTARTEIGEMSLTAGGQQIMGTDLDGQGHIRPGTQVITTRSLPPRQ